MSGKQRNWVLKGHDFSRAEKPARKLWALAPEARLEITRKASLRG
jgi:hypothetical protein